MLQTVEKTAIAGVVAGVVTRLGKQERATARHTRAAEKNARDIAQAQAKLEASLDTILDRIEQGLANVMALHEVDEVKRFLHVLWADNKRKFTLYQVVNDDVVTVELNPGCVSVTLKGQRVSSVQTVGKIARFRDCELGADFLHYGPSWPPRAFFWNLFVSPLTNDYWETSDYRSDGFPGFIGRDFESRKRNVTKRQLDRFDTFTSLTLQKKTDEHLYSLRGYSDDPDVGYWRQWSEMGVDVNHILSRFFYDCADPEVLGKHLSVAINNLRT